MWDCGWRGWIIWGSVVFLVMEFEVGFGVVSGWGFFFEMVGNGLFFFGDCGERIIGEILSEEREFFLFYFWMSCSFGILVMNVVCL